MNILIIGGGGVVGNRLGARLAQIGTLHGTPIDRITLADVNDPPRIDTGKVTVDYATCNITDPGSIAACLTEQTHVVYLLAAIVSAHAEQDFATGYDINMFGTWNVLERCRELGSEPVLVFTSSIAVYGGEVDDPITGHTYLNPQTSYGAQKAMGELLVNDFSRKGYIDGRGVRLPTISVRPGKPNRAASSFMSSIFREPLNGAQATCPVADDFAHYYLSLRKCVDNLVKVAELDRADLGQNVVMQMPGRTWTIRQMIDAMTVVAGPEPAKLIRFHDDADIQSIVNGWRFDIRADKALSLGLQADDSFEDNVRYYLEDDKPTA